MSNRSAEVTTEVLQAFAEAWNRHDADALMHDRRTPPDALQGVAFAHDPGGVLVQQERLSCDVSTDGGGALPHSASMVSRRDAGLVRRVPRWAEVGRAGTAGPTIMRFHYIRPNS